MSDTEHNIGKLIPVGMAEGIEATAKRILEDEGWKADADTFMEALEDYGYWKYVLLGGVIYKVAQNKEIDPSDDIFRASRNEDGTINYEIKFYNGGCSFSEALFEAFKTLV